MKRILTVTLALLAVVGTALAGAYFALSPRFLKTEIESALAEATGRTTIFPAPPRLSLWPEFAVIVRGIKLANPPGMQDGVLAEAPLMRLAISPAALLQRGAEIERITLVGPRLNLVIDEKGRINWSDQAETPSAKADSLSDGPSPLPIFIEDGTVTFSDRRSGETVAFESLDLALKFTSLRGPIEVEGNGNWRGERAGLALFVKSPQELAGSGTAFDLNVSTPRLALALNGHGAVRDGLEIAGQLDLKASSLGELPGVIGKTTVAGSDSGALAVKGGLTFGKHGLAVKRAHLTLPGINASGDLSVALSQPTPRFSARLGIDRLDLDRYRLFRDSRGEASGEGIEAWSTAPIDFSGLQKIDATAALQVKELAYGGLIARNVTIEATLMGGVLDAKLRDISLFDGKASGQVVLNGARRTPTVQASFQGRGLDGHRLLKGYTGFEGIEGLTEVAVAVAAQGATQSEMVASLRGTAGFSFTSGAIRGLDIASVVRGLTKNSRPGWQETPGARTDFTLLKASFTVSDGVAENNDLQFLGPQLRMSGAGNVDLLRRELDFRLEPRFPETPIHPGGSGLAGLGVPVLLKGPWKQPSIVPEAIP
jgi:AsmA protein